MYRQYAPVAPWLARLQATLRQDQVVHQEQPAPLDVCFAVLPRPFPHERLSVALVARPAADEWAAFFNAHGAAGPDYRISMTADYMAKLLLPRRGIAEADQAVFAMEVRCNGQLVGTLLDRGIRLRQPLSCPSQLNRPTLDVGLMDALCVAGSYRGRGVARCMLAWMGHYAAKRGRRVHLNSHDKTALDGSVLAESRYWYRDIAPSKPVQAVQQGWSIDAVEWSEVVQARLLLHQDALVEVSVPQPCEQLFRISKGDVRVYLRALPLVDLVSVVSGVSKKRSGQPMWEVLCATAEPQDLNAACEVFIRGADGNGGGTVLCPARQGPSAEWKRAASQYWHLHNAAWPLEWYQGGVLAIEQGI
jgi:GNAT superfamily N-acetyltransferase